MPLSRNNWVVYQSIVYLDCLTVDETLQVVQTWHESQGLLLALNAVTCAARRDVSTSSPLVNLLE